MGMRGSGLRNVFHINSLNLQNRTQQCSFSFVYPQSYGILKIKQSHGRTDGCEAHIFRYQQQQLPMITRISIPYIAYHPHPIRESSPNATPRQTEQLEIWGLNILLSVTLSRRVRGNPRDTKNRTLFAPTIELLG